jgi:hypothetical protein
MHLGEQATRRRSVDAQPSSELTVAAQLTDPVHHFVQGVVHQPELRAVEGDRYG